MELLVLGLVATIGFASYALWTRARTDEALRPPELDPPERTLATLQPGDIVQLAGTDWLVEGVLTLSSDGQGARLYRLSDGGDERFLFAPAGDGDPALLKPAPELRAFDGAPEAMDLDGHVWQLARRASAEVLRAGAIGERRSGERVGLLAYAAGALRLLVLEWSDHVDAFIGERVSPQLIELLPGK